ncbi:MAG: 23S rRNA (uracil(1939)-C(5))-methyltransferase RlmD, partial [Rhodospirillaceae bacterium]
MTILSIESLDQEGRGVAHHDGKVVFVEGGLPGEEVVASVYRKKPSFELATLSRVVRESPARQSPGCGYFGRCGGCSLQHAEVRTQLAGKQRVLEDNLRHIGKVTPDVVFPAIHGPMWGYRRRARLTARHVAKKGGMLVGFHEKRSSYVADMMSCEVLPPAVSALLPKLRELLGALSIYQRVPQIEVSLGDAASVFVFRLLEPLAAQDEALLRAFAEKHGIHAYVQRGGPETAVPFHPATPADLYYSLPEFDVQIAFEPTDFTQVNHAVNRVLVRRAIGLLAPAPGERIADMFCGLGNFSLPIARSGASVLGIEGAPALVARAEANAARNGLTALTRFMTADLFKMTPEALAALGPFDRMLIDPPRDGAVEVVKAIGESGPRRIVYVSCNP